MADVFKWEAWKNVCRKDSYTSTSSCISGIISGMANSGEILYAYLNGSYPFNEMMKESSKFIICNSFNCFIFMMNSWFYNILFILFISILIGMGLYVFIKINIIENYRSLNDKKHK